MAHKSAAMRRQVATLPYWPNNNLKVTNFVIVLQVFVNCSLRLELKGSARLELGVLE